MAPRLFFLIALFSLSTFAALSSAFLLGGQIGFKAGYEPVISQTE